VSIDEPHEGQTDKPKFDAVASLFGNIVPPPGTPVRPGLAARKQARLPEPPLPDPTGPVQFIPPPRLVPPPDLSPPSIPPPAMVSMPQAEPGLPIVERTAPRPLPPPPPRLPDPALAARAQTKTKPSSRSIPWPDAFEPQPNYRRKPASTYWTWLLLVPVLAVVAIGVFTLNPRTIRTFVDTHFPQLQHPTVGAVTSLLPAPFRTDSSGGAAPATTPASPAAAPPPAAAGDTPAEPSSSAPTPPASEPIASPESPAAITPPPPSEPVAPMIVVPEPAISDAPHAESTPSVPPPETSAAPAIAATAEPSAAPTALSGIQPAISRVIIHYRRTQASGDFEGRRVAAEVAKFAAAVELRPGTSSYRAPTVIYYTPLDRDAATVLAHSLGEGWVVRAGPGRPVAGTVDLWVP